MWKKIFLGALIFFIGGYILFMGGYYVTSSPAFCGSCHEVERYHESWEASAHSEVNCLKCHEQRGPLGKVHSKARGLNYVYMHVTGNFGVPTRAIIFEDNCINCHLGDDNQHPDAVRLDNEAVNHYRIIKEEQSCLDCHRETGHETLLYLSPDFEKDLE